MKRTLLLTAVFFTAGLAADAQQTVRNESFVLHFSSAGIISLKQSRDASGTEFIRDGRTLGHIRLRYRMADQKWQTFATEDLSGERSINEGAAAAAPQLLVVYNGSGWYDYYADLELTERFRLEGDALNWTLHLRNVTDKPLEIADFELPLPFPVLEDKAAASSPGLIMESAVGGPPSSIRWKRADGRGAGLVMTPMETCPPYEPAQHERNFSPARLEWVERKDGIETVYLHSASRGASAQEKAGGGQGPHTSLVLTPKFTPGDEITYVLKFVWADSPGPAAGQKKLP